MRKLAQELGVEAMTLYYHVQNKDDILAGIVDIVVHEFELPSSEGDWKAAITHDGDLGQRSLMRHPWAANLLSGVQVSQSRLRYMDAILGHPGGGLLGRSDRPRLSRARQLHHGLRCGSSAWTSGPGMTSPRWRLNS